MPPLLQCDMQHNGAVWRHRSWVHFTANTLSMLMQVWWKFHSAIVGFFFLWKWSLKFCAWHDSYTVVACVKLCSDMIPTDGVTQKPKIFSWIWITAENPSWNGPLVQHWFRQWLVSWRPQAITWTNVDSSVVGILAFTGIMGDHNVHYSTNLFLVTQILSFYFSVQSYQNFKIYYLLLNTEKTNQKAGLRCNA